MSFSTLAAMVALALIVVPAEAGEVRVAVAANFTAPMKLIAEQFQADTGHSVKASFGATGKFFSQIKNGAPFDVLFAADDTTPERIAREGLGNPASQFTYAIGKLVLWSRQPGYVDAKGHVLQSRFEKLAIANPKLAPYGVAAQEALESLGLWARVKDRIVMGESITQAMQFADSANADMAFIALSQTLKEGKPVAGSQWVVPRHLHTPIRQNAIILGSVQDTAATEALVIYMKSGKAHAVIKRFGYDLP